MRFTNEAEAITYIFHSMRTRLQGVQRRGDDLVRTITPTIELLQAASLLDHPREYAVITGSKGKGSTTAITAKLLQHLGHTVGMVTSPHLVSYRERIRVNGRAIPEADLLRILSDLAPDIDAIEAALIGTQYFSPQGIFLAIALRWFDEQGVNGAVLEVGRGGRFDDISAVPNKLALFTPIMLEHIHQLGPTIERIAWHKAGIIKPSSYVYSVPQPANVLDILQTEAETQGAEFNWISSQDLGEYVGDVPNGIRMRLGRYGEVTLSLMGRYQVANASLAVIGAGNMHARLVGIPHGAPEYVEAIRAGLADVTWAGRLQKLSDSPAIYIDGVTTVIAAESLLESLENYLTEPVIIICAVPVDRDFDGVYRVLAPVCKALILTENNISPNVQFPPREVALTAARRYTQNVSYAENLSAALDMARPQAGRDGTILIAGALPLVGEAMQLWGLSWEVI